jgi:hypothetical protein
VAVGEARLSSQPSHPVAPESGKLVADACHAALALEHGCQWVSTDSDLGRFPGLRWRHPLRPGSAGGP